MKKFYTIIIFVFLVFSNSIFAQDNGNNSRGTDKENEKNDKLIETLFHKYKDAIDTSFLLHPLALDKLINDGLEKYIPNEQIPSVKQFGAALNSTDNSFTLSTSYSLNCDTKTDYLGPVFSPAIKIKGKKDNSFFTFFDKGDAKEDIGIELKGFYFFSGGVNYNSSHNKDFLENKDSIILDSAKTKFSSDKIIDTSKVEKYFVEKELEYTTKNSRYSYYSKKWATFRVYLPITPSEYKLIKSTDEFNVKTREFNNWEVGASLNYFLQTKCNKTFTFSGIFNMFNNNNILTKDLKTTDFIFLTPTSKPDTSAKTTGSYYVGTLNNFVTSQIKAEFTSLLFLDESIGISGAIDYNWGEHESTNWKLGIPITLKDSEGKPSINFELQWREVNKDHFVGISIGKSFGKFID